MFSSEMLRFSHGIPAYRLSGKERKGVPERCIHLDPAALPSGLEKFDPSRDDLHFLTLNAVIDSGNTSTKNNRGARRKKTEKVNARKQKKLMHLVIGDLYYLMRSHAKPRNLIIERNVVTHLVWINLVEKAKQ